jgi:hypothetical protein
MVYRPPLIVPFATAGKVPPSVSATIDASPTWWQNNAQSSDAAAGQVIDSYGSRIRQFIATQRQAVELSDLPIHRRMITFAGLDVYYMAQQGRETIKYVVRPESVLPPPSGGILAIDAIAVEFFDGAT